MRDNEQQTHNTHAADQQAAESHVASHGRAGARKQPGGAHLRTSKNADDNPIATDTSAASGDAHVAADSAEDTEQVAKSTITMSAATLLSRITGFARTWACAFALGNTLLSSAYQVANNVPNMLFELVAGGILTTAFLPVYVAQLKKRGEQGAGDFAGNLLSLAMLVLGVVTFLATVFAPQIIFTQTFMSNGEDAELAVYFFRFFAIQLMFYGLEAIIAGVLNAHKRFLWPALGPVFNNIVVIVTMFSFVWIAPANPELAKTVLAVGTSLGVCAMMVVQIPALIKLKVPIRFHINLRDPALKETLKLAAPATVFVIVNLVVVSVRNAFSLGVVDNGPSTLSYAWLWYQFPYGVLAVALSTAMLTEMSGAAAVKDWPLFRRNVRSGLSATMYLIVPLSILMFVLAEPITMLYHAGQFNSEDVVAVSEVLRAWCLSLPFYAGYMYLYRAFSAKQDLGMVTWLDAGGRIGQATMYALFTTTLFDGKMGLLGIPVADCIFYTVMFFVLCLVMRKKVGPYGLGQVAATTVKSVAASVAAGIVIMMVMHLAGHADTILWAVVVVVAMGILGLAVFYGLSKFMRVRETKLIDNLLRKLFSKIRRRSTPAE